MEGDFRNIVRIARSVHFNPLPPHGGRLKGEFGETRIDDISIHSLRMEGDILEVPESMFLENFNPLPPHGGRLYRSSHHRINRCISIHSLRMEGDMIVHCTRKHTIHFNPLPPHGGRQFDFSVGSRIALFQSTPSAWRETGNDRQFSIRHF